MVQFQNQSLRWILQFFSTRLTRIPAMQLESVNLIPFQHNQFSLGMIVSCYIGLVVQLLLIADGWLLGLVALVAASVSGAVFYSLGRIRSRKLMQHNKKLRAEKHALRVQMNPHFIYNALSSIQELVFNERRLFAVTNIALFAKLIRRIMAYAPLERIPLSEEIETLHLYLKLESLRFENSFHYTISTGSGLDPSETWILPALIQPFIENAIKHGLINKEPSGGHVSIRFDQEGDDLICVVEDDGIGRAAAAVHQASRDTSHQTYSAESISNRIALLNYEPKTNIRLSIFDLLDDEQQPCGTRVEIKMKFPPN